MAKQTKNIKTKSKENQEGRAVARDRRAMRGTCTESLHPHNPEILRQQMETILFANMGKLSKTL